MSKHSASPRFRRAGRAACALLPLCAALAAPGPGAAPDPGGAVPGHLFGTVEMRDGSARTGAIVLGDTDNRYWDDVLTARRTEPLPGPGTGDHRFRFRIFGFDLSGADRMTFGQVDIPFGEIAELVPEEINTVRVAMQGGEEFVVRSHGQEFGERMADLEIVESDGTRTGVPWERIDRIRFRAGAVPGVAGRRLWGTVETAEGAWSGALRWDRDESTLDDVLDGEIDGAERDLKFAEIREVQPAGPDASRVTLRDGAVLLLSGTNDVDRHHRGMQVLDPRFGWVGIDWERVVRVAFEPAGAMPGYDSFDGGLRLYARVVADGGREFAGRIAWDLDERFDWETLDGTDGQVDYRIPFRRIRRLEPQGDRTRVVLRDGVERTLTGTNDVGGAFRGLRIYTDQGPVVDLPFGVIESVTLEPSPRTPATGSGRRDPA